MPIPPHTAPTGSRGHRKLPSVLTDEPAFRLLFASQVLSVLGDRVTAMAMPFAVLEVGGGVREVALVSAAQFLPFVVLALPAGVWADRWNRKRMLIGADSVRLITQTLAALLLLTGAAGVSQLVVLAAVFGAAEAFFAPAFSGLLPATVSVPNLQAANALRGAVFSISNIVGPTLAGLLIAYAGGPGTALALDAVTFAVSAALLAPLRPAQVDVVLDADISPQATAAAYDGGFFSSLRDGWSQVRARPWVLGFLGGFAVYHAAVLPAIFVVGPVLMQSDYDGAQSAALISALFGIGNVLGDLVLMRWRPRRALRAAALMLIGASSQAVIFGSGLPVLSIGLLELLTGVCVTGMFTLWETSLGEHIPSGALSRVSSYDYIATTGVIPLGNLGVGLAAGALGTGATLTTMSAIGVAAAFVVLAVPSVRNLTRPAIPAPSS